MFLSDTFNHLIMNKFFVFFMLISRKLLTCGLILQHEEINANFHNALYV